MWVLSRDKKPRTRCVRLSRRQNFLCTATKLCLEGKLVVQDEDVLTEALKEFGEQYPSVLRPLIEERDEYMVWMLRRLAVRCELLKQTHTS